MKPLTPYIPEPIDTTYWIPSLFTNENEYARLLDTWAGLKEKATDLGEFNLMRLYRVRDNHNHCKRFDKYFGFSGDSIVFYASFYIDYSEYIGFCEVVGVEMVHMSSAPTIPDGTASAFFWKYHYGDGITSISDNALTKVGESVWFRVIEDALKRGLFVGALNKRMRKVQAFNNVDEARTFHAKDMYDWRFFVSSTDAIRENYIRSNFLRYTRDERL